MEKAVSIRGAITSKENSVKEITDATTKLLKEILRRNKLNKSKIINIFFTFTHDLDKINPATAIRKTLDLNDIPMLCSQEIKIKGGMTKCIRVLVQAHSKSKPKNIKHVYLGKAESLRPDLTV